MQHVDKDGDELPKPTIKLDGEVLLEIIEEAKERARQDIRIEIEQQIRDEYVRRPVHRGILGFMAKLSGLIPDSTGKPSGSWTLYLLAHLPVIVMTSVWSVALLIGKPLVNVTMLSPWVVLTPMVLAWIAWLAHHKKVAEVAVMVLEALGKAFGGITGKNVTSAITNVTTTATAITADMKAPDPALKPGEKVQLTSGGQSQPKTDPATIPAPPPNS